MMAVDLIEKGRMEAERERAQLASGAPRPPRFKHKLQRTAAKALGSFFVLMLALTILSRAADGITVARVEVQTARTGVLTQRVTIGGAIAAQGDLELTLPAGLRVVRVAAEKGQRVQAGDTLLELDAEALRSAIEKLQNDIALLDLRIANAANGNTGGSTDAILTAQDNLESAQITLRHAQEDYDRLSEGRGTAEGRTAEDLEKAQQDYDEAVKALEKAKVKAKDELVKAAQEKLDAAKENLSEIKEGAKEAEDAAQQQVDNASESSNAANDAYFVALDSVNRAQDEVKRAEKALAEAEATGDETAIAAAQDTLLRAQSSLSSAEVGLNSADNSNAAAARALKRAQESLKATQEKQKGRIEKAENAVRDAEKAWTAAQDRTDLSEEAVVTSAQAVVDGARRSLESARRGMEDTANATEEQLLSAQRGIEAAQRGVERAQRALENAQQQAEMERRSSQNSRNQAEIERLGYVNERRQAQKQLDGLHAVQEAGGILTAPVAGTVLEILSGTGLTQDGAKAAVLSRSDQGFQFEGSLSQEDAEELAVGDGGTLSFSQDGKRQEARDVRITAIGMADEKGMVKITAELGQGAWPTGASASLEITKRSSQYPTCLPLGALRGDGRDRYVLVLREKQTVMGTEQTVVKVPVTVTAQDSENLAVEASALAYDDLVVVSANKPIQEGDRVRLKTEQ